MTILLKHKDANVIIEKLSNDRNLIRVTTNKEELFISVDEWETSYSIELIQLILDVKGPAYLCAEIMRDEDPAYLQTKLSSDLQAYFAPPDFINRRMLDFGCGGGASTIKLARMFPETEIVGVELRSDLLSVARKRMEFYRFSKVILLQSPSEIELPPSLGHFDFVIMSAVYEHLLPHERKALMPKIWEVIKDGGYLFINQTPNMMFPVEDHTTGLPLLNYLPKPLAIKAAHKFSNRIEPTDSWETLLRKGIRGATEREILNNLRRDARYQPTLIEPSKQGFQDRIDLWYSALNPNKKRLLKRIMRYVMKATWYGAGFTFMPRLTLVIKKSLKDESA